MMPKDFGQEFGEEKQMPSEMQEKTPGVYVRAENELPHELDMLWSNSRPYHKEERSPLISFMAGLVVCAVLTSAVFLLIVMRPQVETGPSNILAPVAEEGVSPQAQTGGVAGESSAAGSGSLKRGGSTAKATTYTVVSGDTLSGIAQKVYGSSAPEYQEKIQRANNMDSPDRLQLDQKLVIPPKDY